MNDINASPDYFRVDYNRQRWYTDPLPGCDIAAPTTDKWPSVSTIAKIAGGDWSDVRIKMAADWVKMAGVSLDDLPADMLADQLKAAGRAALDASATRGDQIHKVIEDYAAGAAVTGKHLNGDAAPFLGSVRSFLGREAPQIHRAEFVAFNRTVGYAGTADAYGVLPWLDPDNAALIDYKTRKAHRLGVPECWQLAAYAKAEYWVEMTTEGWRRVKPPSIEKGYLISITPNGYRVYVVDIDKAWEGFQQARELWAINAAGIKSLKLDVHDGGGPWVDRDLWIRERIDTVATASGLTHLLTRWPEGVPRPKQCVAPYSDDDINALIPAVEYAEKMTGAPWAEPDPLWPPFSDEPKKAAKVGPIMPDEGDLMPEALPGISRRYDTLAEGAAQWCVAMTTDAASAGLAFGALEATPTTRRVYLARSMILACERGLTEQTLSALVRIVEAEDAEDRETLTLGVRLGLLDCHDAKTLTALVTVAASDQDELPSGPMPKSAPEPVAVVVTLDDDDAAELRTDLKGKTVPELRDLCSVLALNVPAKSKKQDLVEALMAHHSETSPTPTTPKEAKT